MNRYKVIIERSDGVRVSRAVDGHGYMHVLEQVERYFHDSRVLWIQRMVEVYGWAVGKEIIYDVGEVVEPKDDERVRAMTEYDIALLVQMGLLKPASEYEPRSGSSSGP